MQEKLKNLINPIIKKIFKNVDKNSRAYEFISMNIITNMLGIGNAATPLGLKAIDELEKENKYKNELSNETILFIAINTASLQIIPTNVIAIRKSLGSENPTKMIFGVWFSSILTFVSIIIISKIYIKTRKIK